MSSSSSSAMRHVPWSHWAEWLAVYRAIFSDCPQTRRRGLDRVSSWRFRGARVPMAIDVTADLLAASLTPPDPYACTPQVVKLVRSMALVRATNGIVDEYQVTAFAQSIAGIAAQIGLPKWVVDVRHEATHNTLPSLEVLTLASNAVIEWLRENYWEVQLLAAMKACPHPRWCVELLARAFSFAEQGAHGPELPAGQLQAHAHETLFSSYTQAHRALLAEPRRFSGNNTNHNQIVTDSSSTDFLVVEQGGCIFGVTEPLDAAFIAGMADADKHENEDNVSWLDTQILDEALCTLPDCIGLLGETCNADALATVIVPALLKGCVRAHLPPLLSCVGRDGQLELALVEPVLCALEGLWSQLPHVLVDALFDAALSSKRNSKSNADVDDGDVGIQCVGQASAWIHYFASRRWGILSGGLRLRDHHINSDSEVDEVCRQLSKAAVETWTDEQVEWATLVRTGGLPMTPERALQWAGKCIAAYDDQHDNSNNSRASSSRAVDADWLALGRLAVEHACGVKHETQVTRQRELAELIENIQTHRKLVDGGGTTSSAVDCNYVAGDDVGTVSSSNVGSTGATLSSLEQFQLALASLENESRNNDDDDDDDDGDGDKSAPPPPAAAAVVDVAVIEQASNVAQSEANNSGASISGESMAAGGLALSSSSFTVAAGSADVRQHQLWTRVDEWEATPIGVLPSTFAVTHDLVPDVTMVGNRSNGGCWWPTLVRDSHPHMHQSKSATTASNSGGMNSSARSISSSRAGEKRPRPDWSDERLDSVVSRVKLVM